jgi:neopullulanase
MKLAAGGYWILALRSFFPYASGVQKSYSLAIFRVSRLFLLAISLSAALSSPTCAAPAQNNPDQAPVVTKVEPPGWWIGLTPELMLLLAGHNLQATEVACNLATVHVSRTQSSAAGDYLFVWIKIGSDTRSGTAVCRVATPTGNVSFELPLAQRSSALGKFQGLSQSDVIYLIMPDRFANGDPTNDEPPEAPGSLDRSRPRVYHGGDLRGIREHLLYLKDLGVSALWLTPVLKNGAAQDYHGYGAVDLYAIDPHLGSLRDYQELISSAHGLGIKVLFDAVVNHTGPNHPWVKNPPLSDWFHGSLQQHENSSSPLDKSFYGPNHQQQPEHDPFETLVDPHAPPRLSKNLSEGWFIGVLPDLNTENPLVAQYLLQNSIWWAETSGLDGYRLDTFPYVPRKFWAGWHSGLRRIYPNLSTIGEVFHPDPDVTSFFAGGQKRFDGIDSGASTLFDYPLYFTLRDVLLRGAPAGKIPGVLRHDSLYPHPDSLITFFGNHDVARFASEPGSSSAKLQLAFALALTLRGIPQFYYGDEIGMTGGADPDNRHDFPGGWPGDPRDAFTADGRTAEQKTIFNYAQSLLRVRREHPVLARGRLWHLASDDSSYVFERDSDEEKIVVAFNNASAPHEMNIPLQNTPAQDALGLVTLFGEARGKIVDGELHLSMAPGSLSIFLLD